MRKKALAALAICLSGAIFMGAKTVNADYFEHHIDWDSYCMQAKDVSLTDSERLEWIEDGMMDEKLIEKSEVTSREFRESNSKEPWLDYQSGYIVDSSGLTGMTFDNGETEKETEVTFYMEQDNNEQNYISIVVNVMTDKKSKDEEVKMPEAAIPANGTGGAESGPPHNLNGNSGPGGNLWKVLPLVNLFIAITAFTGFGASIYSDYKVMLKYNKKLAKRREGGL